MFEVKEISVLPTLSSLGELVRERRKEEGLSQKTLATLTGCSHVAVVNLEKGTGNLNVTTAWRLLEVLGLVQE